MLAFYYLPSVSSLIYVPYVSAGFEWLSLNLYKRSFIFPAVIFISMLLPSTHVFSFIRLPSPFYVFAVTSYHCLCSDSISELQLQVVFFFFLSFLMFDSFLTLYVMFKCTVPSFVWDCHSHYLSLHL